MTVVAGVMLVVGFGFVLTGVIGILRLPDFYCRLHAMGKCDTLGLALMIGGLANVVPAAWSLMAALDDGSLEERWLDEAVERVLALRGVDPCVLVDGSADGG